MTEWLQPLFRHVCGQDPAHTWSAGGVWLPCCQRCTGVYVGAFVAALLHFGIRFVPTVRWRWAHGGMLLAMIPFGFHWLPQGPALRAMSGVVFGFGLVAFLRLTLPKTSRRRVTGNGGIWWYSGGLLATAMLVPWLGAGGNAVVAGVLAWLAAGGALVLCGLVAVNLLLALRAMGHLWDGGGKAHGAGMARGASGGRALPCFRRDPVGRGRRTRRHPIQQFLLWRHECPYGHTTNGFLPFLGRL